ncbi:MAG: hypothetical protein WC626_10780 [Methanoregula sp.]
MPMLRWENSGKVFRPGHEKITCPSVTGWRSGALALHEACVESTRVVGTVLVCPPHRQPLVRSLL